MKNWKRFGFVLPLLAVVLMAAQEPYRRPPAPEYIKILESPDRVERMQVDRVIETLDVSAGQRIADLGAGSGLFARPLARKVGPQGVVYAIDIDPELLEHVEKTAREQELQNIRTILAAEDDPKIPEPVDLIFIADTLHHIDDRPVYLKNLRRYLRPSGRVAIIDFSKNWPPNHGEMKYSLRALEKWMNAAGFRRIKKHGFLNNQFFVIYQGQP